MNNNYKKNNQASKLERVKRYYEKINADPKKTKEFIQRKTMELLSESEKTRFQIEEFIFKRIKKELYHDMLSEILDYYEELNYLNDKRYAEYYIRNRYEQTYGKNRIEKELIEKGIKDKEFIREELDKYDFEKLLFGFIESKYPLEINEITNKDFEKLKRKLITKGFDFDEISKINKYFKIKNEVIEKEKKSIDINKLVEKLVKKGYGINKIKQECKQNKIELTNEDLESYDFYEIIKDYKESKFGKSKTKDPKQKQKEINHLLARGFLYEEIKTLY